VACVLPHSIYETWFVAAAESLIARGYLQLKPGESIPDDPEGRLGKNWIADHFIGRKGAIRDDPKRKVVYSETIDQRDMTNVMILEQCRANSRSFKKLCIELEKRIKVDGPEAQVP
jgi:hypothetical protein